jgi:hypothetical protein
MGAGIIGPVKNGRLEMVLGILQISGEPAQRQVSYRQIRLKPLRGEIHLHRSRLVPGLCKRPSQIAKRFRVLRPGLHRFPKGCDSVRVPASLEFGQSQAIPCG